MKSIAVLVVCFFGCVLADPHKLDDIDKKCISETPGATEDMVHKARNDQNIRENLDILKELTRCNFEERGYFNADGTANWPKLKTELLPQFSHRQKIASEKTQECVEYVFQECHNIPKGATPKITSFDATLCTLRKTKEWSNKNKI